MSKYKYIMRNYHAIKEAEITLNGITVLSGINGCGKSTLSRWLYYIVNGTTKFDNYLFDAYKNKLYSLIGRMQIVCSELARIGRENKGVEKGALKKIVEAMEGLEAMETYSKKQIESAQKLFLQALYTTENILTESLKENISDARKARIFSFLYMDIEDDNYHQAIENFTEQNSRLIDNLTKKLYQDVEKRPVQAFFESINDRFNIDNDLPSFIQLEEDRVSVIEEEHVSTLFNLRNAIYIDTPMSVGPEETDNIFWRALRRMMMDEKDKIQSAETKKFLLRIKDLLNGEAILDKGELFEERNLRYISADRKINIGLNEAATGFKSFSYLQRLLENGYLNEETLLMIDEPEAHLHPQWIVEFARLLVLLNKKLGLKIMIASHNPDMVAAIHDIANKEGVLNDTNFYVAQPESPDSHQYIYKSLGHEIGEIFESFNIAIENINRYGAMDL